MAARAAIRLLHRIPTSSGPAIGQVETVYDDTGTPTTPAFSPAPGPGDVVFLPVNSNTTINTAPPGATQRLAEVANQGTYAYDDTSGATTYEAIMNGGFFTNLAAIILEGTSGFGQVGAAGVTEGSAGQTSRACPSITTGAHPHGSIVLAVANMHSLIGFTATTSWDNGFTEIAAFGLVGSASSQCYMSVAYKIVPSATVVGVTTCTWLGACDDTIGYLIEYPAV